MVDIQHPNMHTEIFHTGCKVNLFLHITGRRKDGYHLLNSLFYPLSSPSDTLEISALSEEKKFHIEIEVESKQNYIESESIDLKNNTLTKAYALFYEKTDFCLPLKIKLSKGIPHGAGLGGGSADAAILLKYLFKKYKKIDYKECNKQEDKNFLQEIALNVGADVPFFLENKEKIVSGIGEIFEDINKEDFSFFKNTYLLLLCPQIKVNTVWAFKEFRQKNQTLEKNIKKNAYFNLTKTNKTDIHFFNAKTWAQEHYKNDLEDCVFSAYPLLKEYKEKLYELHASLALMSGSGSSLFALFESEEEAQKAEHYFRNVDAITVFPCVKL